jgi:uncharacterized DUF497 family protein
VANDRRGRFLSGVYVYTTVGYPLRFTWDHRKSADNLLVRGFDFEFATFIFDGRTLEREDIRRDYGERRIVAIGYADEAP